VTKRNGNKQEALLSNRNVQRFHEAILVSRAQQLKARANVKFACSSFFEQSLDENKQVESCSTSREYTAGQ